MHLRVPFPSATGVGRGAPIRGSTELWPAWVVGAVRGSIVVVENVGLFSTGVVRVGYLLHSYTRNWVGIKVGTGTKGTGFWSGLSTSRRNSAYWSGPSAGAALIEYWKDHQTFVLQWNKKGVFSWNVTSADVYYSKEGTITPMFLLSSWVTKKNILILVKEER